MPRISKIERLPTDLLREIEARLIAEGNDGLDTIAADIQARGHAINADNLYRHARKLRAKVAAAARETEAQRAFRRLRGDLERAGIRIHARDEPVERLLMELGALRLRERVILARISAVADLAEIDPSQI